MLTRKLMKNDFLLWLYAVSLSTFGALAPIYPILITVGVLIAVDTVLGVWASVKRKEAITSGRAGRVLTKFFVYQMVLVTLFMVETNVWGSWLPAVKIAAGAVCVVEVISLLENSGTILGKPVFKYLIDKLGSKSKK